MKKSELTERLEIRISKADRKLIERKAEKLEVSLAEIVRLGLKKLK